MGANSNDRFQLETVTVNDTHMAHVHVRLSNSWQKTNVIQTFAITQAYIHCTCKTWPCCIKFVFERKSEKSNASP